MIKQVSLGQIMNPVAILKETSIRGEEFSWRSKPC